MVGIHDGNFGYGGYPRSYSFGNGGSFRKDVDTNVVQLDDLPSEQFFIRNNPLSNSNLYYRFGEAGGELTLQPGEQTIWLPFKHTGLFWIRADSTATAEVLICR